MKKMKDIGDAVFGAGAGRTVIGTGVGGFLYELVQGMFPGAAKAAAAAPTNQTDFIVWIVLIIAGFVLDKPGGTADAQATDDQEPQ